jgi:hypothetical protein
MTRRLSPHARAAVTVTHAEWMEVAAALVKPWPPEAVRIDLDFREQLHESDQRLLGRGSCMERWGWTESTVRRAFEGRGPSARR